MYKYLALIALLAITFFAIQKIQTYQGKAQTAANDPITLLVKLEKNQNEISVTEINAYSGKINHQPSPLSNNEYILETSLDSQIINSVKFNFNQQIFGLPPKPGTNEIYGDTPLILPNPTAIILIPYSQNSSLEIRHVESNSVKIISPARITGALQKIRPLPENPQINSKAVGDDDGFFDILFISSHYSDFNLFREDSQAIADFILQVIPFSEYRENIRIHSFNNNANLGCHYEGRLIICNPSNVLSAAAESGLPFDQILVIENNNTYGGAGYLYHPIAVTYRDVSDYAKEVAVHEMGHSFGHLFDEYDYEENYSGSDSEIGINCDYSPCAKWSGADNTGCFPVCGYSNLFRPTYNSCLMRTLTPNGGFHYDSVDQPHIRNLLAQYQNTAPTTTPAPTGSNSVCSGNSCSDCILNNRPDILLFYQNNGWDISCSNQHNIINNWCNIDPNSCNLLRSNQCANVCQLNTPTPTQTPTPQPTIPSCNSKAQGDANCDGHINGIDLGIFILYQCIKTSPSQVCSDLRADFNNNGEVDGQDRQTLYNNLQ